VLAIASKGDVAVLAAALAIGAASWPSAVAVTLAMATASTRVGTTSLRAISGAQSVLGPAGWNGPTVAVAASWLAAAAVIGAARPLPGASARWTALPVSFAFGATAAAVVSGPGPGGALAVRVVGTLLASALAAAVVALRRRAGADRIAGLGAALVSIAAVALGVVAR
jgi:hypothetical protein